MNFLADSYRFRARIIPEFLASLPLSMIFAYESPNLAILGFFSLALFFVFFQGVISAKLGRKLEKKLRKSGKLEIDGGYVLRIYEASPDNKFVKNLVLAAKKFGLPSPFENTDKDEIKSQCIVIFDWLRGRTRDREKFPTVIDKLADYGFFRNMLAMRPYACIFTALSVLYWVYYYGNDAELNLVWVFLVVMWGILWFGVINLKTLQVANIEYIEALLKTSPSVEGEANVRSQEI